MVRRQIHRINSATDTQVEYYLKNMCLPFFYCLIKVIKRRFGKYGTLIHYMYDLIPLVPRDKGHVDIKEAINQYKDDPPSQLLVDKEYSRWMSADKYERPTLVAQTITLCNKNVYPNI